MTTAHSRPVPSMHHPNSDRSLVEAKLIELANDNFASMLLVNVTVSLCVSFLMVQAGYGWVLGWLAVLLAICAVRAGFWHYFNTHLKSRLHEPQVRLYCRGIFGSGLLVTGAMWSGLIWVSLGQTNASLEYFLMIIASALAGGATGSVAPLRFEGRIYVLTLLVPASLKIMFAGHLAPILGFLGLMFAAIMVATHAKNHEVLRESLKLRVKNNILINNLTDRNRVVECLNATLEARVIDRTEALHQIAHHDHLTGLLNRRGLLEWMTQNLRDDGVSACALFLDLDRFKQINDGLGHEAGDHVLRLMAKRLSDTLPEGAIIGRWGGDEFVVVALLDVADQDNCKALALALIDALEQPFETDAKTLTLGVSIGTSLFPQDALTPDALIHAADLAAAEVKRTGRGQVIAYEESFAEIQRRHFDLTRALGHAIAGNELRLAYQPIIEASSGDIAAFEVLLRWQHPQLGLLTPDVFIPLAEDSDQICEIGDWVLSHACEKAAGWANARGPGPKVAVNVSMRQLLSEGFAERVALILATARLAPDRLDLEVTESLFDEEGQARSLGCVQALRALGVGVHIDDFGTGFSSLSRLYQFPVTAIKIDKTFVAQLHAQGHIIIESTLMIARRFGLKVVAEGVETLEQARELKHMGVDYFQGYYFARPQFEPLMKTYDPVWIKAVKRSA